MGPIDAVDLLKKWFKQENLSYKMQPDQRAEAHFLVKYPGGKQGHMFAVVVPKGRDLVAISSMTKSGYWAARRDGNSHQRIYRRLERMDA